jgi:myb proto-oncogene protein
MTTRRTRRARRAPRRAPPPPQDALLLRCVGKHGPKNWSLIARSIPGRTGKSCRLRCAPPARARAEPRAIAHPPVPPVQPRRAAVRRAAAAAPCRALPSPPPRWLNQLNPSVKKEPFSGEEDAIIMAAHTLFGNKWASISKLLVGRCARLGRRSGGAAGRAAA